MKTLKQIIGINLITNFPVNIEDVSAADDIFVLYEVSLCGKTVRTNPQEVNSIHVNLSMEIIAEYQSVLLSAGYMFVKGVLFFNTYSCGIKFITPWKQDLKTDLTIQSMKSIKAYYAKRGFKIVEMRADHKFEPAQAALAKMGIDLDASVGNEHVLEVERLNMTMK